MRQVQIYYTELSDTQLSLIQRNTLHHFSISPRPHSLYSIIKLISISIISRTLPPTVLGPPTHQPWGGPVPPVLLSYVSRKCANPDSRPEALWETHVPLPILRSNQGGNGSSLHKCVKNAQKKQKHVRTQTGISVCLEDRDGEIRSPPTDGYHASGKEQAWTARWQLLPKKRGMRRKKTKSTSSILCECEVKLKKVEEDTFDDSSENYLNKSKATETINTRLNEELQITSLGDIRHSTC